MPCAPLRASAECSTNSQGGARSMRLVKIGLASVNTTVGAFARNVDKALDAGAPDGRRRRHRGRLPGAAHRRLPARGPGAVAGLRRPPVAPARALRPGDGLAAHRVPRGRGRRAPGPALQLRRARGRREGARAGAQGEAAHLQHLLRGAHLLARLPRHARGSTAACPSATTSSASTSASSPPRSARTSGAPTAPCAGAPTRAPSWW